MKMEWVGDFSTSPFQVKSALYSSGGDRELRKPGKIQYTGKEKEILGG